MCVGRDLLCQKHLFQTIGLVRVGSVNEYQVLFCLFGATSCSNMYMATSFRRLAIWLMIFYLKQHACKSRSLSLKNKRLWYNSPQVCRDAQVHRSSVDSLCGKCWGYSSLKYGKRALYWFSNLFLAFKTWSTSVGDWRGGGKNDDCNNINQY